MGKKTGKASSHKKKSHRKPDDGFLEFDSTLEHGLALYDAFCTTEDGERELNALSPALRDILIHFVFAARRWVEDE